VRYPRGAGPGVAVEPGLIALPFGKAQLRRRGRRIAVLAFGTLLAPALAAGEALDATVVNMRWVKPVDLDMLRELAAGHEAFVTVEEHVVSGGAGSAVAEALAGLGLAVPMLHLGLPDRFVDHGEQAQLLRLEGLDAAGLERSIRARYPHLLPAEATAPAGAA
jgi:1-deoxy-D-xylulose-5-phosphate synthase